MSVARPLPDCHGPTPNESQQNLERARARARQEYPGVEEAMRELMDNRRTFTRWKDRVRLGASDVEIARAVASVDREDS